MSLQRSLIAVVLLSCCLLMLPSFTSAYRPLNHACCVKYTRRPLPFNLIKGYVMQSSLEVCRMDAIIFFTVKNRKVCASTEDDWVKATLTCLSDTLDAIAVNGTVDNLAESNCQLLTKVTDVAGAL